MCTQMQDFETLAEIHCHRLLVLIEKTNSSRTSLYDYEDRIAASRDKSKIESPSSIRRKKKRRLSMLMSSRPSKSFSDQHPPNLINMENKSLKDLPAPQPEISCLKRLSCSSFSIFGTDEDWNEDDIVNYFCQDGDENSIEQNPTLPTSTPTKNIYGHAGGFGHTKKRRKSRRRSSVVQTEQYQSTFFPGI